MPVDLNDALRKAVADAIRRELAPLRAQIDDVLAAGRGDAGPEAVEYLSTRQAAQMLGLGVATLEGWRAQGRGPRYAQLGRRVAYRRADLETWVRARLAGGDSTGAGR